MEPSSSNRASIKVPPGQAKKIEQAIALVRSQYAPVLSIWRELTPEKRRLILAHSPLLAKLLEGVE